MSSMFCRCCKLRRGECDTAFLGIVAQSARLAWHRCGRCRGATLDQSAIVSEGHMKEMFEFFDRDGSGLISRSELLSFLQGDEAARLLAFVARLGPLCWAPGGGGRRLGL